MKTLLATIALGATVIAMPAMAQEQAEPRHDMTRTEAQQRAVRMFQLLDVNHDGNVTKTEADQAFAQFQASRGGERSRGGARTKQMIDQAFAATQSLTQAQFEAQAIARFEAQDTNKDGFVSAAERQQSRGQQDTAQQQPARPKS
jgi:Ca2+-binding EF-hand superfamily protein